MKQYKLKKLYFLLLVKSRLDFKRKILKGQVRKRYQNEENFFLTCELFFLHRLLKVSPLHI